MLDPFSTASVIYTVTSIEALALRLRQSVTAQRGDCHRVLDWAKAELDRLSGECGELIEGVREAEVAEQAAE